MNRFLRWLLRIPSPSQGRATLRHPLHPKGHPMTDHHSRSILRTYLPVVPRVAAVQVTPQNAAAVAQELGGRVEVDRKASDPTDVATLLYLPTLDGVKRLLVHGAGPVVGRRHDTGEVVHWDNASDFEAAYRPSNRFSGGTSR